jgi:hypothetical protein
MARIYSSMKKTRENCEEKRKRSGKEELLEA